MTDRQKNTRDINVSCYYKSEIMYRTFEYKNQPKKDLSSGYPTIPTSPRSVNISSRSNDISDISTLLPSRSPISPSLDKNFSEQSETLSEPAFTPSTSAEFFSSGVKRQFSRLSPPLLPTTFFLNKKDKKTSVRPSPARPAMDTTKIDLDFAPVASPSATYADRPLTEDFMSEVRRRLCFKCIPKKYEGKKVYWVYYACIMRDEEMLDLCGIIDRHR
ncbi:MAG: hypothetical protein EXX96DRAFT_606235 [Benjaminiella poitrasii]|nr:MAG: hypothetical protein EXX96DRAFT_606235 [Benjaminiella poitrasii]